MEISSTSLLQRLSLYIQPSKLRDGFAAVFLQIGYEGLGHVSNIEIPNIGLIVRTGFN